MTRMEPCDTSIPAIRASIQTHPLFGNGRITWLHASHKNLTNNREHTNLKGKGKGKGSDSGCSLVNDTTALFIRADGIGMLSIIVDPVGCSQLLVKHFHKRF